MTPPLNTSIAVVTYSKKLNKTQQKAKQKNHRPAECWKCSEKMSGSLTLQLTALPQQIFFQVASDCVHQLESINYHSPDGHYFPPSFPPPPSLLIFFPLLSDFCRAGIVPYDTKRFNGPPLAQSTLTHSIGSDWKFRFSCRFTFKGISLFFSFLLLFFFSRGNGELFPCFQRRSGEVHRRSILSRNASIRWIWYLIRHKSPAQHC